MLSIVLSILGYFHSESIYNFLDLTIDNVLWMIFYLRAYLGLNVFVAKILVLFTILGTCFLLWFFIAGLMFILCARESR